MKVSDDIKKIMTKIVSSSQKDVIKFRFYRTGADSPVDKILDSITGRIFTNNGNDTQLQSIGKHTFLTSLGYNADYYDGIGSSAQELGHTCVIFCLDYPRQGCVVQFYYDFVL